jgi:anthranilate phosphoribosyltransferase
VHGDRIDDFTVTGPSKVTELLPGGETHTYVVTPEEVGLGRYRLADLAGSDPEANATALRAVLAGESNDATRDVVAFNAGAALYLADVAADLAGGVAAAREALASGAALAKLDEYVRFSQEG